MVDSALIAGDRSQQHSGTERAAPPRFKRLDAIPDSKESLLHQILGGRGIANDRDNHGVCESSEAVVEVAHRESVPLLQAPREVFVVFSAQLQREQ